MGKVPVLLKTGIIIIFLGGSVLRASIQNKIKMLFDIPATSTGDGNLNEVARGIINGN